MRKDNPSLINIQACPIGIEMKESPAMYARTGMENVPVASEKMMHTHQVIHCPQSNGLIGFRSFALSLLAIADLHDCVKPERSTT